MTDEEELALLHRVQRGNCGGTTFGPPADVDVDQLVSQCFAHRFHRRRMVAIDRLIEQENPGILERAMLQLPGVDSADTPFPDGEDEYDCGAHGCCEHVDDLNAARQRYRDWKGEEP